MKKFLVTIKHVPTSTFLIRNVEMESSEIADSSVCWFNLDDQFMITILDRETRTKEIYHGGI